MLPGDVPLFSVVMTPTERPRRTALVVCHSYFEMKMFQGTELSLLRQAAEIGYPGIYVQVPGMGDSHGATTDCLVEDRVAAVLLAADHVLEASDADRICFVGARFGAAIALLAATRCNATAGVALWDPTLRGDDYWRELRRFERVVGAIRGRRTADPDDELATHGRTGTVGFPVTQQQRDDLRTIDAIHGRPRLAIDALVVGLNDAQLRPKVRQLEPLLGAIETATLSGPRPRHLIHLRIADAQGSIQPTVSWLQRTLP